MFGSRNIVDTMMRLTSAVALTVAVAGSMSAQGRTLEVEITLTDAICNYLERNHVDQVSIVTNALDQPIRASRLIECTAKFRLRENQNLDISIFSLRLGDSLGRTPCMRAKRIGSKFQLVFTRRGGAEARKLEFEGGSFDYVREVAGGRDGEIPCWEEYSVPGTLSNVQFDIEDLRLQLFEEKTVACGVILDDVAALGKAKKGDLVSVTIKELTPVVVRQGLKGENCYAPTLTPPEAIEQSLSRKGRFDIKVK